jgi:hypothetical protein
LPCCRNLLQGNLTSALFFATQWRNIKQPRLLSQRKVMKTASPITKAIPFVWRG